jgi:ankyrin repeat protein
MHITKRHLSRTTVLRGFAVPALVLVSLFSTVTTRAASRTQPDDTRLPEAAQNGDQAEVLALLRDHVSVDSAEGDGTTALHWAAYQNNLALAEELLNAHANVNAVTRLESVTPLYMACESGSAPMVELLLKHGATVNQADGLGTTPLMMAAASGNAAVVKVLLDHGADVNVKEHAHEQTALMFAANLNRADVISVLLTHGADPNAASKVEHTNKPVTSLDQRQGALLPDKQSAAKPGEKPVSNAGVTSAPEGKTDQKQGAALPETASPKPAEKVVSSNSGAMPVTDSKKDDKKEDATAAYRNRGVATMGGMTPLLFAARQGNIDAITALLAGGANINETSGSEHTTPLVMAIMNGHYDLAKVLVEHGADVNLANDEGVAPLWATVDVQWPPTEWSVEPSVTQEKTDYLSMMKLLLAHGENPNARIKEEPWERVQSENRKWTKDPGATAFFRAAQAWDVPAMKLLKDNGADPTIATDQGTTPLMAAAGLGWAPMWSMTAASTPMAAVQYCVGLGTDVNVQNKLGYTALHGAAFIGDLKVIQYLVDHGADVKAKNKAGDTVADLANGPFEKSQLHPDAVALLVKLGSTNSNNCRSSSCEIKLGTNVRPGEQPAIAATPSKTPAADSTTPAVGSTKPTDVTLTTGKKPDIK